MIGVWQQATVCMNDEYNLVNGDARLARIMQEQERLDAMVRREQKRIRRAQRAERQQRERLGMVSVAVAAAAVSITTACRYLYHLELYTI